MKPAPQRWTAARSVQRWRANWGSVMRYQPPVGRETCIVSPPATLSATHDSCTFGCDRDAVFCITLNNTY